MRGKDFASSVRNAASGITPAYAGKSSLIKCFVGVWKDHPRLCGEKPMALHRFQMDIGSPPPMRGKVMMRKDDKTKYGITPAYAGKSRLSCDTGICS